MWSGGWWDRDGERAVFWFCVFRELCVVGGTEMEGVWCSKCVGVEERVSCVVGG